MAHGSAERQKLDKYRPLFEALGIEIPMRAYDSVAEVEHLYVPELAFGWGKRFEGSPAFRDFVRQRLSKSVEAAGGEDLYISRSRLWGAMGQIIGEEVLEENLESLGYEVFHPQEHPVTVQLAKYKAARRIVALDGSALHLVPFICPEGGKTAIIKRRSTANVEDYQTQFKAFCGTDTDVIDTLRKDWVINEKGRVDFRAVGELDFAATFRSLAEQDYIPKDYSPVLPSEGQLETFRLNAAKQRDGKMYSLDAKAS